MAEFVPIAQDPGGEPEQAIYGIAFDLHCPSREYGGLSSLLPQTHTHYGHSNSWYYLQINTALIALGYVNKQYSVRSAAPGTKTREQAIADAIVLETLPNLTWMSVPGVVRRMHVVSFAHAGNIYPPYE